MRRFQPGCKSAQVFLTNYASYADFLISIPSLLKDHNIKQKKVIMHSREIEMEISAKKILKPLPGIIICLAVAFPAWFVGTKVPEIGGPTIAILAGIIIATIFPKLISSRKNLEKGVKFTSKKLLQYSIILLGFSVSFQKILQVGGQSLIVMVFTLSAAFLAAFLVGKFLKVPGNTTTLVGVGTSICGGSAIAATAPIIKAKDDEVARAISTIFLFNIIAVFIFPALGRMMGLSDAGFGMWAGTAINDTSSVVAAGTSWSAVAGNNIALNTATIVKLTRTLMIVPITLFLAMYMARKSKQSGTGDFNFRKIFPWFVLLFVLAAVINSIPGFPGWISGDLAWIGTFMIIMAMAAIGLSTNLKSLIKSGPRPILLGLCCWIVVAVVSLIAQGLLSIT